MKLYYLPGTCSLASHIVLEWTGQTYHAERVDRQQIKQDDYLALNPLGAVPVLVDDDFVLTQSVAILEYLAELKPEHGLLPKGLKERAEVHRWLGFCNSDIHRTFALIFGAAKFADTPQAQNELAANAAAMLANYFAVANTQLAGKDWMTGQRSIVDPYLYVLIRWAKMKKLAIDDLHELQRFYDRMEKDPGVQTALKAEGLV